MDPRTYDEMRALEGAHWWFAARREILADQIAGLRLPDAARILEVGCGTGGNLELLSRFGDLTAVEPDDRARAYAAERSGLEVRPGRLPSPLPAEASAYDLVAALDVVEHVDEDVATVGALRDMARPGGHVLVTVPAYQWMWSGHDLRHHHKRRYTADRLKAVFEGAGLPLTRLTYFNTLLFPPIAGVRLLQLLPGVAGGDDERMPSSGLNALLRKTFAFERKLLARMDLPFGVSILAMGRRPLDS
jgi:SAM-dependent methyltransferase